MTTTNPGCLMRILQMLGLRPLPPPVAPTLKVESPPTGASLPTGSSPAAPPPADATIEAPPIAAPITYRPRRFLSPAETSFYGVLRHTVSDSWVICPKVRIGDLFTAK